MERKHLLDTIKRFQTELPPPEIVRIDHDLIRFCEVGTGICGASPFLYHFADYKPLAGTGQGLTNKQLVDSRDYASVTRYRVGYDSYGSSFNKYELPKAIHALMTSPVIRQHNPKVPLKVVVLGQGTVFALEFALLCYLVQVGGFSIASVCAYDPSCNPPKLYRDIQEIAGYMNQHFPLQATVYRELARVTHFFSTTPEFYTEIKHGIDLIFGFNVLLSKYNLRPGGRLSQKELFYALPTYTYLYHLLYPGQDLVEPPPDITPTPSFNFSTDCGGSKELRSISTDFVLSNFAEISRKLREVVPLLEKLRFKGSDDYSNSEFQLLFRNPILNLSNPVQWGRVVAANPKADWIQAYWNQDQMRDWSHQERLYGVRGVNKLAIQIHRLAQKKKIPCTIEKAVQVSRHTRTVEDGIKWLLEHPGEVVEDKPVEEMERPRRGEEMERRLQRVEIERQRRGEEMERRRQKVEIERQRRGEEMERQRQREEMDRQSDPDETDLARQIQVLATQSGIPCSIERAMEASKRVSTPQAGLNWLIDNL